MSAQDQDPNQTANPYLSPNQQDLLLRALKSQSKTSKVTSVNSATGASHSSHSDHTNATTNMSAANNDGLFMSPQNAELDSSYLDYTPDLDYMEGGESFDFENADLGGDMIGALPGSGGSQEDVTTTNGDGHEKRKSRDESHESEGGDAKRQEMQEGEKGAKKPGRKPLTSEPTTVSDISRHFPQYSDICRRNAKHRTEQPNVPLESAKKSISKIWRPKCPT